MASNPLSTLVESASKRTIITVVDDLKIASVGSGGVCVLRLAINCIQLSGPSLTQSSDEQLKMFTLSPEAILNLVNLREI